MILWFRDSKNDAKKGIWGQIVKLFGFASTIMKFDKNEVKIELQFFVTRMISSHS